VQQNYNLYEIRRLTNIMADISKHGSGLHHVCVYAADIDATLRFYTSGLGFIIRHEWNKAIGQDGITFVRRGIMLNSGDGSTYVEIFPAVPDADAQSPVSRGINHFCLRTGDCDASYKRALSYGGQPFTLSAGDTVWDGAPMDFALSGTTSIDTRLAYLQGPDGEVIEFFQNEVL